MLIKWLSISHSEEFLSPGECSALPGSLHGAGFVAAVPAARGGSGCQGRGFQEVLNHAPALQNLPWGGAALQVGASAFGVLRSHLTLGLLRILLGQGCGLVGQPAWVPRAVPVACGPGSQSLWGCCRLWAGSEVLSCGQPPSRQQLLFGGQPWHWTWQLPRPCTLALPHVLTYTSCCARSSSGLCGS